MKQFFKLLCRRFKLGKFRKKITSLIGMYTLFFNIIIEIFKNFIVVKNNTFLFCSYEGTKYDDSPKAIFDYLREVYKGDIFRYVWAFQQPIKFILGSDIKIVKLYSFRFFYECLRANYIISNAVVAPRLNFIGSKTIYLNTWHGTALKKIGKDRKITSNNFCPRGTCIVDIMTAQSQYDIEIFSRAFMIPKERFILTGMPRNDELIKYSNLDILKIKEELSIPSDKKVILYAPTYRNYEYDENKREYIEDSPIHFSKWQQVLGDEYVVLFRAHYYIAKILVKNLDSDFVIDVSSYHSINNLIAVSYLLVSDYSSIFFDYSITEKPMLCYPYDR